MNFIKRTSTAALALFIGFSGAANAATFDLTDSSTFFRSEVYYTSAGDYTTTKADAFLTITSGTFSKNNLSEEIDDDRFVTRSSDGLGVRGVNGADDEFQVDGEGGNDLLIFSFASAVNLRAIGFGSVDSNGGDDFAFGQVTNNVFARFADKESVMSSVDLTGSFTAPQLTGTAFGIGAIQNNDDFRVASLTFDVAAVPLPASSLMLLSAFGAAGAFARRKQKAS